jgi:hypothetical protein
MLIKNEDVREVLSEIPEGHIHIRTTVTLQDGASMTFQEATIANLVRAYINVKTHPAKTRSVLKSTFLQDRKDGFAEWQLIECS